jgi:RecB family exonuclease
MPARLFTCTPTKLVTWSDCPRRFRFTYLDRKPKGGAWAHNSVGLSVHNALRDWFTAEAQQRTLDYGAQRVAAGWIDEGFRDSAQSREWQTRAAEMTVEYLRGQDPVQDPIGVERTVSVATHGMALSGRVDRIDLRASADGGEELVIVDYKTGRRPLDDNDARTSLALAAYVVAAAKTLRRRCRRVELHHLPTSTVAAFEHSADSLDRQLGRAQDIAHEADQATQAWRAGLSTLAGDAADGDVQAVEAIDAVFPPRPGVMCSWCDYRRWCPAGQDASEELKPWDGLAQQSADDSGD